MKSKPFQTDNESRLRFTPTAWAKLLCLRDAADAEVGAFGLSDPEDLLLVRDVLLVKQEVSSVTVAFDDEAVANVFEDLVEHGFHPEQFGRIWLHTHPGSSPNPSTVDEDTFERVFGSCHWSVMFILARAGRSYARLRFAVGPGGSMEIPCEVDYSVPFGPSDKPGWLQDHRGKVHVNEPFQITGLRQAYELSELADLEVWNRELMLAQADDGFPGI